MDVIVNADDLGYSERRDRGILSAYAEGLISSASLMVTGDTATEAALQARQIGLPLGLHLNLSEGTPLTTATHITDEQGQLLYKMKFWFLPKTQDVLREIAAETLAQLERFKELTGAYPVRVDGHQHVHVAKSVPAVLAPILKDKGVKYVRIPDQDPDDLVWLDTSQKSRYETRYVRAVEARLMYGRHGLKSPLCFVGLGISGSEMTMNRIQTSMRPCFGSTEFMVHPGFLRPAVPDKDAFDSDPGRLREYHVLKAFKNKYTIVDWTSIK